MLLFHDASHHCGVPEQVHCSKWLSDNDLREAGRRNCQELVYSPRLMEAGKGKREVLNPGEWIFPELLLGAAFCGASSLSEFVVFP